MYDQLNGLADQALNHAMIFNDKPVQIEYRRVNRLPAAECEELMRKIASLFRGFLYLGERKVGRVVGAVIRQQRTCITENYSEHIVEVVRHTTGKTSDAFQFLGLAELNLQFLVLSRIAPYKDSRSHPARDIS